MSYNERSQTKGSIMFNRAFKVKMIKTTKAEEPLSDTEKAALYDSVADAANRVIKKVAMAALAYVVVDTARQVAVARSIKS